MSNSISTIYDLPQEIVQHVLSFDPLSPAYAQVNLQFRDTHTDLLRQNIRQIFKQCSAGQATLNVFINSLKEHCRTAELQGDYSDSDAAGVNKMHQLIVQKIQNFGIPCPNRYVSPQEIREYSAAIEDSNLQKAWGVVRQAAIAVAPLNPPATDESAATIRAWMDGNVAALQRIRELDLSNRELTCIPKEIALLTGLQTLELNHNQISELPVGIFNGLVGLQTLFLHRNQISELPVGIFNEVIGLQKLSLQNNQIRELSIGLFSRLVELQWLYVNRNQTGELPPTSAILI